MLEYNIKESFCTKGPRTRGKSKRFKKSKLRNSDAGKEYGVIEESYHAILGEKTVSEISFPIMKRPSWAIARGVEQKNMICPACGQPLLIENDIIRLTAKVSCRICAICIHIRDDEVMDCAGRISQLVYRKFKAAAMEREQRYSRWVA